MPQPIRRTESHFEGSDRTRLVRRGWQREAPERVVLLVHGFGEHSARYDEMAEWLAQRGCAVHAWDHRGHGLSEGRRNHVRHFDEYVGDLAALLDLLAAEHGALPRSVVGHSMGGLVVARALVTRSLAVTSAVLSGAALAVGPDLSRTKQWAARLLARIAPTVRSDSGLPVEGLSRDPEVVRRYQADPLVRTDMTVALGAALLAAQRELAEAGVRVQVPLLGLHGGDDPICPAWATERFVESVRVPGSHHKVYPGLRHEIFNEPEREQVWNDLLRFIRQAEAEGAA
jgi:alpha-beta hydrolase superfamily lysophospholipase